MGKLKPELITPSFVHELFVKFLAGSGTDRLSFSKTGDGVLSMWPDYSRVLVPAFQSAQGSDDDLDEAQFGRLLKYLAYYNEIWILFEKADSNDDGKISYKEFQKNYRKIFDRKKPSDDLIEKEFKSLDVDGSGFLSFEEVCDYFAKQKSELQELDSESDEVEKNAEIAAKFKPSKTWTKEEVKELFERFDANNNNGLLSLAEIDKAIMDLWPEMGKNKQAIMRAYKTADVSNDGFVTIDEFGELLTYLSYYDKLYTEFKKLDLNSDKRLDLQEFKKGHELIGLQLSDSELQTEFDRIDSNGGGIILFDEFCHYMATKFGRPGTSKKVDLITQDKVQVKGKTNFNRNTATPTQSTRETYSPSITSKQPLKPIQPRSGEPIRESPLPSRASETASFTSSKFSGNLEHKLAAEQLERKRLERVVESLRHQLHQLSPGDDQSRAYLSGWEALKEKNYQLQLKLEKEQKRNDDMKQSMLEMAEKIKRMETEAYRDMMEETKRARQSQAVVLSKELKEVKAEKAKFERLCEEMARKCAAVDEKNQQLAEEVFMLKQQLGINAKQQLKSVKRT